MIFKSNINLIKQSVLLFTLLACINFVKADLEAISVNLLGNDTGNNSSSLRADLVSEDNVITPDGRYVVFSSFASNLVANDFNNNSDIFVRDTLTNTTTLVSINLAGSGSGDGLSIHASITPDGRYVVFQSRANNLVSNDTNLNAYDVFVRDLIENTTRLISTDVTGNKSGNSDSTEASITPNGRYVVFQSKATNLVANDTSSNFDVQDIFLRDLQTNTTHLVSKNLAGNGTGSNIRPSMSLDGRFIVYSSNASDHVTNDQDIPTFAITSDVFRRDMLNEVTTLVSVTPTGNTSGNESSVNPSITPDGRFVFFTSRATDLVNNDADNGVDLYVRDMHTNSTKLVSVNIAGSGSGNGSSGFPKFTPDGRYVAFKSAATNLVSKIFNRNDIFNIYLRDLLTNTTELVSVDVSGTSSGDSASGDHSISDDGRYVVFSSSSRNLVSSNTFFSNVFIRDRLSTVTSLVSIDVSSTRFADGGSGSAVITPNGRFVVFRSGSSALTTTDTNGFSDIFLYDHENTFDVNSLAAAILPVSRSVQVGQTATAFASIINTSNETALGCRLQPKTLISASFSYQTTDPATNMLIGNADTPVDISAGNTQTFIFSFIPTTEFEPTEIFFEFICDNSVPAPNFVGINTFLLSSQIVSAPDIIGLTTVVDLQTTIGETSLFGVASANVGATGDIYVSTERGSLPLTISVCQLDQFGACIDSNNIGFSANLRFPANGTASFGIFVTPSAPISNNPVINRIYIRFRGNNNAMRGATSTAVRTQ